LRTAIAGQACIFQYSQGVAEIQSDRIEQEVTTKNTKYTNVGSRQKPQTKTIVAKAENGADVTEMIGPKKMGHSVLP
jgi:hypothetical protein